MAYNVYKSTNKGHDWTLQGTTEHIPPSFIIGGESSCSCYNTQPWPNEPGSATNPQDGYVDGITFDDTIEYDNTSVFSISIAAPDEAGGTTATATPVMAPSPSNPGTKVVFSSATITDGGTGYYFSPGPVSHLLENGANTQVANASVSLKTKYITYSLSGTEWSYNIVTPLGTDLKKLISFQAIYSGYYFGTGLDLNVVSVGIFTGTDPTAVTATLNITGATAVSIPANLSSGIYIVVDNSLYKFATTTWNLIGTLTNTTTDTALYPSYIIKVIVETSNGFFAKVTDNPATTTYIFKSTDLLNWSNEQTLGSSDTYDEVTQYLYSFDDNTASFTSTNYLSQIA